jgi:hypothetical protein
MPRRRRQHPGDTVPGSMYLLHIEPAYRHAQHYLGWTHEEYAEARVAEHLAGRGSPLIRAAVAAGCVVTIERTWTHVDRHLERRIKRNGARKRCCPRCTPTPLTYGADATPRRPA